MFVSTMYFMSTRVVKGHFPVIKNLPLALFLNPQTLHLVPYHVFYFLLGPKSHGILTKMDEMAIHVFNFLGFFKFNGCPISPNWNSTHVICLHCIMQVISIQTYNCWMNCLASCSLWNTSSLESEWGSPLLTETEPIQYLVCMALNCQHWTELGLSGSVGNEGEVILRWGKMQLLVLTTN